MPILSKNETIKQEFTNNLKSYKNLYMFNGIMFVVLGTIALIVPLVAAEFIVLMIGLLLLLTGFFQILVNYSTKRHWSYYLSAIISIIAGTLLLLQPYSGVIVLTVVVAIFMLLQGLMQLFYASVYAPFPGWRWLLLSGAISIALAIIVYAGWPISAMWFLGVLIGVNLISIGFAMIMLTNIVKNT